MDRFIENESVFSSSIFATLKSNMDRFIDFALQKPSEINQTLKSNMDRFIVNVDFI